MLRSSAPQADGATLGFALRGRTVGPRYLILLSLCLVCSLVACSGAAVPPLGQLPVKDSNPSTAPEAEGAAQPFLNAYRLKSVNERTYADPSVRYEGGE